MSSRSFSFCALAFSLLAQLLTLAAPTQAQCRSQKPFNIPPAALWDGKLQPYPLGIHQKSFFNEFQTPSSASPLFREVAEAGGYLIATHVIGGFLFDVSTEAKREAPELLWAIDGFGFRPASFSRASVRFPQWFSESQGEFSDFIYFNDAILHNGQVYFALAGRVGLTVFRFNPATPATPPVAIYQDWEEFFTSGDSRYTSVALAEVEGRLYAFAGSDNRVRAWDLTQANGGACTTEVVTGTSGTCGANSPYIPSFTLNGVSTDVEATSDPDGSGPQKAYLAVGRVTQTAIYELNLSGNDVQATSKGNVGHGLNTHLDIWRHGSTIGLAADGDLFNLTSCVNAGGSTCGGAPDVGNYLSDADRVVAGSAGSRTYLWAGIHAECSSTSDREALFDITDFPGSIVNVEPQTTVTLTGDDGLGGQFTKTVDYFQYYYADSPEGSGLQIPWQVDFGNDFMFRTMESSVDTHRLLGQEPSINIQAPPIAYHDVAATFTATGSNCPSGAGGNPSPTGWDWSATGSASIQEDGSSTALITWTGGSTATVTATNTACDPASGQAVVTLEDPAPVIEQVRANGQVLGSTAQFTRCELIDFDAVVSGLTPLTYNWSITPDGPQNQSSSTLQWDVGTLQAGNRQLNLTLSNGSPAPPDTRNVTLEIQDIGAASTSGITFEYQDGAPVGSGAVIMHANSSNATEWRWEVRQLPSGTYEVVPGADFGEGEEDQALALPLGEWRIRVTARNCLDPNGVSAEFDLDVTVDDPPIVESFDAGGIFCQSSGCVAQQGNPVSFTTQTSGTISTYAYDFDNTTANGSGCSYSAQSSTPINSFTYNTLGVYYPCVRVTGPGGQDSVVFDRSITVESSGPSASISLNCPSSTTVGNAITCTASPLNCGTLGAWNWSASGGGSVSGSGSSVSVSWGSTGSKTVTATNPGCVGAQGTDFVSVSSSGGGGGPGALEAVIELDPDPPVLNQEFTLDGSDSTGSILSYEWTIRQNNQVVATYSTEVATHTFTQEGTYEIALAVADRVPCGSIGCLRETSRTVVIGQGGGGGLNASFTVLPTSPQQGDNLLFNGAGSTGDIVEYAWSVRAPSGGTETGSGQSFIYNAAEAGVYEVTLRVASEEGCETPSCSSTTTNNVNVQAASVLAAIIRVLDGPPVAGQRFTLDASASTGAPTGYLWEVDGFEIDTETVSLTIPEIGDLVVKLTVFKGEQSASTTETIVIGGDCNEDDGVLCLNDRRFKVEVGWTNFQGEDGVGTPFGIGTLDSGLFWFFQAANAEMLVKVLDACSTVFNSFWFSVAATTDVAYELTVTDLATGQTYEVSNPLGTAAPAIVDTGAFFTCDAGAASSAPAVSAWHEPSPADLAVARATYRQRVLEEQQRALDAADRWAALNEQRLALERQLEAAEGDLVASGQAMGTCVPDNETLCLLNNRFEINVDYRDQTDSSGPGILTPFITPDSGVYYFFDRNNWEFLVKMVEGCVVNDFFWVFAGATTDQEYTLTVKDTVTGAEKVYFNPLGTRAPAITDNIAFPCDA